MQGGESLIIQYHNSCLVGCTLVHSQANSLSRNPLEPSTLVKETVAAMRGRGVPTTEPRLCLSPDWYRLAIDE